MPREAARALGSAEGVSIAMGFTPPPRTRTCPRGASPRGARYLLAALAAATALTPPAAGDTPPATTLRAIEVVATPGATVLEIQVDGELTDYERVPIEDSRRVVIDLPGVGSRLAAHRVAVASEAVAAVRVGLHPDKARVVVDLAPGAGETTIAAHPRGLSVRVSYAQPSAVAEGADHSVATPGPTPTPAEGGAPPPYRAPQVYQWIDEHGVTHYTTDPARIPRGLRPDVSPPAR